MGGGMVLVALKADESEPGKTYRAELTGEKGGAAFSQAEGSTLIEVR